MMIASQISPVGKTTGMSLISTGDFNIICHESQTGVKIVLVVEPNIMSINDMFYRIQILFSEHVNTNPFYQAEMPIKIESFEQNLQREVSLFNSAHL